MTTTTMMMMMVKIMMMMMVIVLLDSENMKPLTGELVVAQCLLYLYFSKVAKGCRFLSNDQNLI